jgi:hypothetical protein
LKKKYKGLGWFFLLVSTRRNFYYLLVTKVAT